MDLGLVYLAEWGISAETVKRFEENEISLELMKCMNSEELKELVPNIRERIVIRSGLEKLYKLIDDTSSEAATASDNDYDIISAPSSPASSSNEHSKSRGISRETYYIPGVKYQSKYRPAKGKLIDRYNNQRRLLQREGVLGRKRKLAIENIPEHSDIEEDEDTVIWLQYNKEPFQEVKEKWLGTRKYRIYTDYKNAKNLQDIFKKYPLLKQGFGYQFIEFDFEYCHPKKDLSLFVKFPEFLQKATDAFGDVKVFQDLKAIAFNDTTKEDTKAFIALSLLCGKLVPTVGRSERRKDKDEKRSSKDSAEKKKYNKPTILESRDSLILHVKTQSDIQNCLTTRRDIHRKKGLTCQPVVICVGPDVENVSDFYVNFDDVTIVLLLFKDLVKQKVPV